MAQYDGSIRINTNIDTSGITQGMHDIRQAIERGMSGQKPMRNTEQEVKQLGDSMSDTAKKASELKTTMESQKNAQIPAKQTTSQLMVLEGRIDKTTDKIASLRAEMDSLRDTKIPTQEYKAIESDIAKSERELEKLIEKQAQMQREGKDSGATWEELNRKIQATKDYIEQAKSELQDLVNSGKAFTLGTETEKYKKAEADVKNYENVLNALIERQRELNGELQETADIARLRKASENIDRSFEREREEERRRAETPPKILNDQSVESWQRGADWDAGIQKAQELAEAVASVGQNAQDSATKSNEAIASMTQELAELKARQKELEKSGMGLGFEEYDKNVQRISEINAALKTYQRELINTASINAESSYERLSQALDGLTSKLNVVFGFAQKVRAAFSQDINVSGYDKLDSTLFGLRDTAIQASKAVMSAFAALREDPLSVVHVLANGLMNLATTVNSNVIGALNVVGEKIGFVWGVIMSVTFKAVDAIKEKMAGFANFALNTLFHPIQTLKNVANPIIKGFGNIFKFAIEKAMSAAAGFAASVINGILHPIQSLKNASNNLENIFKKFGGVARNVFSSLNGLAKKLDNGLKKLTKTIIGLFAHTKKNANSNNNMLKTGFKNILKYGLGIRSLYVLVNKIRNGIKEGFSNFMEYSSEFKSSIDSIKASVLTLKNAFAAAFSPLVEIAIPYIQRVIDYLVKLLDVIGQVMAAITGQETYTRAIKQTTAAIEDQNKAQNKQLSGLDKLNNLTSSRGGGAAGSAADMFEEAPIEDRWKKMAEKLKKIGEDFFKPIKEAWDKEGKFVMDSWNLALNKIGKLAKDVGKDFLQAWNQSETIAMFENIFHVVGDIGVAVGNLAKNFREAWNTNNIGLRVFENVRDILAAIINNIRLAADYTVVWSNKLDFYPLLSKIEEWTSSLIPVFDALSGIVMDFYTTVLLPLAQWTLEKGLPDLLQVFINFNEKVDWEGLRERLTEFWKYLEPFAETIGEGLIIFIDRISDTLANFVNSPAFDNFLASIGNWMSNVKPEDVANALEKLAIAIIAIKGAVMGFSAISAVIPVFKGLASVLGLFGPAGVAVGALALAAFLSKTIEDVDMGKVGQAVGNAIIKLVDFIGQAFSEINWYMLGQKVVDFIAGIDWISLFTSLIEALVGILGNVFGGIFALNAVLSEGIANLIINAVDAAKEYFQEKIEECGGNIVLGILKGIVDGIVGIGNWIVEHIFQPFITGFKNAFGIHSPSTVMMEMGTYIIQGLLDGITSLVDKVTETWESMKETALEVWESVKTGLSEKWEKTKEKASEIWGNVKDNFAETWNLIEESASEKWGDIKENLLGKWEDMKTNASTIFTDLKTSLSGIWDEISTTVSDKWNEIKTTISGVVDDVKGKIDGFISNIKDAIQSVKDFFSSGIDKIGSAISGAFSGGGGAATYSGVMSYSAIPQMAALSKMEFPGYATGQVIPTSMKKHLAWLGDNNHETEVVSPISTMKEALLEGLIEAGLVGGSTPKEINLTIPVVINDREVAKAIQKIDLEQFKRTGKGLFAY